MTINLTVNGMPETLDIDPETPLLDALRNDLELNGPKFGCGLAQCGACSVLMNGKSVRSCVMPVSSAEGQSITTLEGLGDEENPHPLQKAFIDHQAIQCGYCANGIIISAAAFLNSNPNPELTEIKQALSGHLCRCGAQPRMLNAVVDAAKALQGADDD